jgi:hypothetical protein
MSNQKSAEERERIWVEMAAFFVDNEIDFDDHAATLCAHPPHELKTIFFREVAPVCASNMQTPAPPVWLAFDDKWVIGAVRRLLLKNKESALFRLRHGLHVLWLRASLAKTWSEVERAIERQRRIAREIKR